MYYSRFHMQKTFFRLFSILFWFITFLDYYHYLVYKYFQFKNQNLLNYLLLFFFNNFFQLILILLVTNQFWFNFRFDPWILYILIILLHFYYFWRQNGTILFFDVIVYTRSGYIFKKLILFISSSITMFQSRLFQIVSVLCTKLTHFFFIF